MIQPAPASEVYKPDHCSLLCSDEIKKYLTIPDHIIIANLEQNSQIIPSAAMHPNPWKALSDLDIVYTTIKEIYHCPYTTYPFYTLIPIAILSTDINKYRKAIKNHPNGDYTLDHEWHRHMMKDRLLQPTKFHDLMLGSGYTYECSVNDGSNKIERTIVELDNGDSLLVHFWQWFNK